MSILFSRKDEEDPNSKGPLPWVVLLLLRIILPSGDREFFMGDMGEAPRRSWLRELLGALSLRFSSSPPPRHSRSSKGDGPMQDFLFDLKHGLRLLARSPGFTAVALITMALGIGANTAMFSIVNGVVLSPLPYPDADRILLLRENNLSRGWSSFSMSPLNFWDWEEQNRSLELMAAYQRSSAIYTGGDRPESLEVYRVTEEFLEILGGEPFVGRGLNADDVQVDSEDVVLLTHPFWERAFAGDSEVLGRTMLLDGRSHTIIGVLPEEFRGFSRSGTDLVLPLKPQPYWYTNRGNHFLVGIGRLREGVTVQQAQAEFSSIAAALEAEYPETNNGWGAQVVGLREILLGDTGSQLFILFACVGLVLLIACANLANMTLARATGRIRELAVRTAVGAGRSRVIRQLLAESLLLAVLGGALGMGLAHLILDAFQGGWPTLLPRMQEIQMDTPILLFSLGLALLSGILFGLAPGLTIARSNLHEALRQGGRTLAGDRSRRWLKSGLVVAEVSLAMVLLVGTGLLVRSFAALQDEDPGFQTHQRLIFSSPVARASYPSGDALRTFSERAVEALEAIPETEAVALSSLIPLEGSDQIWGFWKEENALPDVREDGSALFYRVTPGYFEAMGIPLLSGRDISPDDQEGTRPVVIISQAMAQEHFAGKDPLGRAIRFGNDGDEESVEIIGVAGEVHHYSLTSGDMPQIYVPFAQRPTGEINFVIKAAVPPMTLAEGVRETMRTVDPNLPVTGLQAAGALISESVSLPRFRTVLMTAFGLTALLLAVVGLYGVMAYSVTQRRKEIGVRMALGADQSSVLGMVLREGLPLVVAGMVLGLGGAFSLSRLLGSMLFGVGTQDPMVFTSVPLILVSVALGAMLIPARKASRVDPVQTLGEE